MTPPDLEPDLKRRVLAAAQDEPSPTRGEAQRRASWLIAGAAIGMVAAYLLVVSVMDAPFERPGVLSLGAFAGALSIAASALWISLARGRSTLGRPRGALIASAASAPALLLGWKLGWSGALGAVAEAPARLGLRCLLLCLITSALPLTLLLLARRGTDPRHPAVTGAALGAAVGALAWGLTDLWCPVTGPRHLLLGHLLPVLVVTAVGAVVGWWLMPPPSRPPRA